MALVTDVDNLDDRREIRRLLDYVEPERRWAFLRWVASLTRSDKFPGSEVTFTARDIEATQLARVGDSKADDYISNQVYYLTFMMATQHSLDCELIARRLTDMARKK